MPIDFQEWLIDQGYYRNAGSLIWWYNGEMVGGAELCGKLNEWKAMDTKSQSQSTCKKG